MQTFQITFLLAFFFLANSLFSQESPSLSDQEATLVKLSTTFLKDSITANRIAAEKSFKTALKITLEQSNSFHFPFEKMESVSILYPTDSTFRIFSWQLYVDKNDYRYGGLIQMNTPDNPLFELNDQSGDLATYDIEYDILSKEDWYGVLYFNLQEYDSKEGKKYLLFGFDGYQFFHKRKVLDVLHFDENGEPSFGAPAFAKAQKGYEASTKNRLYIEYSAEVAAKLNYDAHLGIIIQDHLVTMKGRYKGQGNVNIPDGSYEGYQLKNGLWEFQEKIFDLVSEKPPAPRPILENKSNKDLFGKTKKSKKKKSPKERAKNKL